ncbi:ABC transporter [Trypanosoma theileri]|uniref:ABC transporter n=1 Tax=Trypanosoma theileri TaxID=67003 RepID=A0A1X0P192_9TRYP|nr:ABC transporter [Trypanosoma theileri]ORC90588.1 ABC transporter [Trypanosoma theileri]
MFSFFRRSAPSSQSRLQKWGRRFFITAGVLTAGYITADYSTANSLTRSLRAVKGTIYVSYLYKTTVPTTPEEFSNLHRQVAEVILDVCLKNEGLYTKMGQGLNAMNHILPVEYMDVLKVLLDKTRVVPLEDIKRIIHEETGKTVEDIFSHFEPEPVASASIAQVHRAWLRPTRKDEPPVEVAVKVQKPQIRYQVFWDLETYRFITWTISTLFGLPMDWVRQTVAEGTRREINFSIEANNAKRIRQDFAHNINVYVPKVYDEYATSRLLVMEWVDGVKLIDVKTIREQFNATMVLKNIFDAFGSMIFQYGFVHCDPHGANILVRPIPTTTTTTTKAKTNTNTSDEKKLSNKICKNPQIVLLDFGLCCPETEKFRMEYALLFKSMVSQDLHTVERVVGSWGITDAEVFASIQLQKPYESFRRGNRGEVTMDEVCEMQINARERTKTLLKSQERVPRELPLVGRSIDILRGLNRLYGAPINRVNMFVRQAVAGLGPINTYEEVQLYLVELDRHSHTQSSSSSSSSAVTTAQSLFDTEAEIRFHQETAASIHLRRIREASLPKRINDTTISLYRGMVFEFVLFFLNMQHMVMHWYNTLWRLIIPRGSMETPDGDSMEELLQKRQLRFISRPSTSKREA